MNTVHVGLLADPASPTDVAHRISDLQPRGEDPGVWDIEIVSELGMVLANRPWRLVPGLKFELVAALAAGAVATFVASAATVGGALGTTPAERGPPSPATRLNDPRLRPRFPQDTGLPIPRPNLMRPRLQFRRIVSKKISAHIPRHLRLGMLKLNCSISSFIACKTHGLTPVRRDSTGRNPDFLISRLWRYIVPECCYCTARIEMA